MKEKDILYEHEGYWISTARAAGFKWDGFCIWKNQITHSRLCGRIGWTGEKGMTRAKLEIEKRTAQYFWTYERDDEVFDGEFQTKEEAQQYADDLYQEECLDQEPCNGEHFSDDLVLIKRYYSDVKGDFVDVLREETTVDYEHYHGDFAEHTTWHKGNL